MSSRTELEKRYQQILNEISNYLGKLKTNLPIEVEREYYLFIEQDAEKLLNLTNDGIISVELLEKIIIIYKRIIYLYDNQQVKKDAGVFSIVSDLYYIFKYVIENALFLVENEFLLTESE